MREVDWSLWTGWQPLSALDGSQVPRGPGAYIIAASQPINRAVNTDPEGYLDVGESDSLAGRLGRFLRANRALPMRVPRLIAEETFLTRCNGYRRR